MTWEQAKERLGKLARGRYHVIKFGLTNYGEGINGVRIEPECSVYIDKYNYCTAKTWETALSMMEDQLMGDLVNDVEQAPTGEAVANE